MIYSEFTDKIEHNSNVLKNALDTGKNLLTIAPDLYTWNNAPGELHFSVLMRNVHDIIPCAFLGALANTDNNGIDGFFVDSENSLTPIEVKTSELASTQIWKGPTGGLYFGKGLKKTQCTALTSRVCASYNCHTASNILSKNLRTFLFISDTDQQFSENSFIDAWELPGKVVVEYLQRTAVKQRTIKFGSFMKNGHPADTVVPLMGFEAFKSQVELVAPDKLNWLSSNGYIDREVDYSTKIQYTV